MNNTCEAFERLKSYLVSDHGAKIASGGKEVIKRCHRCGDSKDPRKAHMYIGMKDSNIVYNCFLCGGGVVDQQFFRDINCYDADLINMVINQNKSDKIKSVISDHYYRNHISITNTPSHIPNYSMKLDYLKNRLGINLDDSLNRLKIILSLKHFLYANYINTLTRDPRIVEDLDKYFIGFVCVDNNHIIMRRIVDSGIVHPNCDSRYVVYVTDNRFVDENNKIYIIPCQFYNDNFSGINIHIAEGPFDILGIYFNTNFDQSMLNIFAAVGGKSYDTAVKYILRKVGFINFNLHFYFDRDVDENLALKYRNEFLPFGCKMFVHRNCFENERDFGVPDERIKDVVKQYL